MNVKELCKMKYMSQKGRYYCPLVCGTPTVCVCVCVCVLSHFSHVRLCATLWTAACQIPLCMGFSRPEYWVGCHTLLQGIFPTQKYSNM